MSDEIGPILVAWSVGAIATTVGFGIGWVAVSWCHRAGKRLRGSH